MENKMSRGIILILILSVFAGLFDLYRSVRVFLYSNNVFNDLWRSGHLHDALFLFLGAFLLWRLNHWGRYLLIYIYCVISFRLIVGYFLIKSVHSRHEALLNQNVSLMSPQHAIQPQPDNWLQIFGLITICVCILSMIVIYYLLQPKVKAQFKALSS